MKDLLAAVWIDGLIIKKNKKKGAGGAVEPSLELIRFAPFYG